MLLLADFGFMTKTEKEILTTLKTFISISDWQLDKPDKAKIFSKINILWQIDVTVNLKQ